MESTQQLENPWDKIFKSQQATNRDLPKNYYLKHFDNMEIEPNSQLEKIVAVLRDRQINDPVGIWFTGGTGAGKTYLLTSLFNFLSWNYFYSNNGLHGQVKWWSYVDLTSILREDPNNFEKFQRIRGVDLLFIDDIGITKGSDFIQEKIYSLFNYRLENELPTFVTTNLNPDEIKKEFGERMLSRIKEGSAWLELKNAKDRRSEIFKTNMAKYSQLMTKE